jgi:hypothetical protein
MKTDLSHLPKWKSVYIIQICYRQSNRQHKYSSPHSGSNVDYISQQYRYYFQNHTYFLVLFTI